MAELGLKPGEIFPLIRVLLAGQKQGPPMFEMMELLGKEVTIQRLQAV
jgi:glutamyl-tRNA synthetase